MNKVILMGRLTRDVDLRQTASGISVARFTIAVNRRFASRDAQQTADFISCVAWRQNAEFVNRYFHKGSMIAVVGTLQSRSWDDKDGKRQYSTEVSVEETYFTGSRAETGTGQQDGYNQSYRPLQQQQPRNAAPAPQETSFDNDFDDMDFGSIDGSEDDLPF